MIGSSLIQPLVGPLVKRRGSTGRRASSALNGTRILATALAVSALASMATPGEAEAAQAAQNDKVVRSAHKRPTRLVVQPRWHTAHAAVLTAREELAAPGESAAYDRDALRDARHRHKTDRARDAGPGLGFGRRLDRLLAATDLAFSNFGSATVLAAQPHS